MLAKAVTDLESNVRAYRVMAEMLVGLRKIILHGLRKQSGDRWASEGCPSQVYERLVERKERELAVERFAPEYEDLMSFATFGDLAEIIQANEALAGLLRNLAPSPEVLCARLIDLETLRAKLARAIPLNPDELSLLTRYSTHLRDTLAGARRKTRRGGGRDAGREEGAAPRGSGHEPATDAPEQGAPVAAAPEAEQPPIPEVAAVGGPPAAEREPPAPAASPEVHAEVVRPAAAEPPRAAPAPSAAAPSALDPEGLAEGVQEAMVDEDDREVLRLLRREAIATAEAMYRGEGDIPARGWQEVERDGWLGRRREELALAPLEQFHELRQQYEERRRSPGSAEEDPRALLAERGFPKLLLALREMFLRNGL